MMTDHENVPADALDASLPDLPLPMLAPGYVDALLDVVRARMAEPDLPRAERLRVLADAVPMLADIWSWQGGDRSHWLAQATQFLEGVFLADALGALPVADDGVRH